MSLISIALFKRLAIGGCVSGPLLNDVPIWTYVASQWSC